MSQRKQQQSMWRSRLSNLSTAISISMVIYVLGIMGFILLKAQTLTDASKEKFRFEVYLKEGVQQGEVLQLKKILDAKDYVIQTEYKDKATALEEFRSAVNADEDFLMVLGKNPLPENIDVYLSAAYTHPDSVKNLKAELVDIPIISDFRYPSDLLYIVHNNVRKISVALLIVGGLLLVVAVALINNTIRLKVYAQRFTIRTMQLIGATRSYVRRPFLRKAFMLGFLSGALAVVALLASLNLLYEYWPEFAHSLINIQEDFVIYLGMIAVAIFITWISTLVAVSRYLRLKTDKLYF